GDAAAAEGEDALHQRTAALAGGEDAFQLVAQAGLRRRPGQRHLAVTEHGAENVVEVVRDAARERAERFEPLRLAQALLRLAQRLLGILLVGNIHRRARPT